MIILQVLLAAAVVGVVGFIAYWFGVFIKAGTKATKDQIDNNPKP